jgi:hypothetical protein
MQYRITVPWVGRLCFVICAMALASHAAASPHPDRAGLRQFIESIPNTVPPEFASDLVLRAAGSVRADVVDGQWLAFAYQRAFDLADGAQSPLRRRMLPWTYSNTHEAIASSGYDFGVDATSLRARAVRGLLRIDPRRALALLERVDFHAPPLSCAETMMYDVTAPFGALADVVRHFEQAPAATYDADDAARARTLLTERLGAIASSAEIAPAIAALLTIDAPMYRSDELWNLLATRIRVLRDDDRTFSASLMANLMQAERLIHALDVARARSTRPALEAFREHVVTHMATRRCSLGSGDAQAIVSIELGAIAGLNGLLSRHRLPPIQPTELRGSHTIPSVRMRELWHAGRAAMLRQTLHGLLIASKTSPADAAIVAAHHRALVDFMNDIATWTADDERSPAHYFHQRLALLAELSHDPSIRTRALEELIGLLKVTADELLPVEWFAHVGGLLDRTRTAGDRNVVMKMMSESGHPVLVRYAHAERLAERPR